MIQSKLAFIGENGDFWAINGDFWAINGDFSDFWAINGDFIKISNSTFEPLCMIVY